MVISAAWGTFPRPTRADSRPATPHHHRDTHGGGREEGWGRGGGGVAGQYWTKSPFGPLSKFLQRSSRAASGDASLRGVFPASLHTAFVFMNFQMLSGVYVQMLSSLNEGECFKKKTHTHILIRTVLVIRLKPQQSETSALVSLVCRSSERAKVVLAPTAPSVRTQRPSAIGRASLTPLPAWPAPQLK